MLGPVRTSQNSVCFVKQSFKSKPFLVQTIFTYQNFLSVTKLKTANGCFYTKDALSVWTNLGKHFVVRLVMRL